jgi:ubiquinone/menaquinone biosynthesis C-methylase UbiE
MKETDVVYSTEAWARLPLYGKFMQDNWKLDLTIFPYLEKDLQDGENILDVGCGSGRLAFYLNWTKRDNPYTGLDITPYYIELARKALPRYTWVEGDCRSLPFPDQSFDVVCSTNLLIHLPWDDVKKSIDEMVRVARKAVYLCGSFAEEGSTHIELDIVAGMPFLFNVTPFSSLIIPGWTVEKIDDGRIYVVLRKS